LSRRPKRSRNEAVEPYEEEKEEEEEEEGFKWQRHRIVSYRFS
jgi:hypothetical protein